MNHEKISILIEAVRSAPLLEHREAIIAALRAISSLVDALEDGARGGDVEIAREVISEASRLMPNGQSAKTDSSTPHVLPIFSSGHTCEKCSGGVSYFGDIEINSDQRTIEGPCGKRFASPIEINLITTLANAGGLVIEKDALKMRAWGQLRVTDHALHRKLHSLRTLLKDVSDSVTIETKYGVGFHLKDHRQ